MADFISFVVDYVSERNPLAAKKIKSNLKRVDENHAVLANIFFAKYDACLRQRGLTFAYGVDCYLKLLGDMTALRIEYLETGRYANDSFEAVNKAVYANADVMAYHMHGLALAQFLWPDQYTRFKFFRDNVRTHQGIESYLEIGGGHALYIDAAMELLPGIKNATLVDISESSMTLAKCILHNRNVNFVLDDVFNLPTNTRYDFITIGEVIEHLEKPLDMLLRLKELLAPDGTVYLTTPANAPMIDHIHLFRDEHEIRAMIEQAGFMIVNEVKEFSENMPEAQARELKVPLMYAAFLKHA